MKSKFDIIIKVFLFISICLLFVGFFYLYSKINKITSDMASQTFLPTRQESPGEEDQTAYRKVSCDQVCENQIAELISSAIATLSASTTTQTIVQTPVQEARKTTYVPLGTSAATTSTSWTDVADSGVYIDVVNDYGQNAKVSWEVSLKVAHGNGKAYARLWDDTNKIAVDFSEISTENNTSFQQVSSGNLPFWRGRNLYKVQIKSLNSFEITYSGGRIKVSY